MLTPGIPIPMLTWASADVAENKHHQYQDKYLAQIELLPLQPQRLEGAAGLFT